MRFLISVAVAVLTAASVQAQTKEESLKELQQKIVAIQKRIDKLAAEKVSKPAYQVASEQAVAASKPLVLFRGVAGRPISGAVVQEIGVNDLPGSVGNPGVTVFVPANGWLDGKGSLPETATDADIHHLIKGVSQVAAPFQQESAVPDVDLPDEVSSALRGMVRYRTTRVAQASGNRSGGGANSVVSRLSIPSKWQQPGGLEGLIGWSNKLYRNPSNPVKNWLGHVDPNDRWADGRVVSNWGGLSEITYQREYGDGAKFADVLATAGGVFEVRIAEKIGSEWKRSIPYRNRELEPVGYKRVSLQQCAECHNQAGDGAYGTARIIGGDGVLSEPFPGLE